MCAYESEILLFQLHFYARKRNPGLEFNPEKLKWVLNEWGISNMRQLFDLPSEAKIALTLPLMKQGASPDSSTLFCPIGGDLTALDQEALVAA